MLTIWRTRSSHQAGFSLAELIMVIAVIGILAVMAVPAYLRYHQAAILKSGAQQVVTMINQARELALKKNDSVCVRRSTSTQLVFALGPCGGGAGAGAGTDAAGNMILPTRCPRRY